MTRLLLWISLPLYLADQLTKAWIVRTFALNGPGRVVIPDFFTLHHVANTGIAFGQFNGGRYSNYVFGAVALTALGLILWALRKGTFTGGLSRFALALLVAGICGNFTDRMVHGYVVDFLSFDLHVELDWPFHLSFRPWPSFNVADSCVVCAAILLAIASFTEAPKTKAAA